jgi:hypothetical protein
MNKNQYLTELFEAIINHFNDSRIEYLIIRNYEGYPKQFTGDIDVHINPRDARKVNDIIEKTISEKKWELISKLNNASAMSYSLFNPYIGLNYRNIIVFDIFKGFTYLGFEYFSFNKILKSISIFKGINVAKSPNSEFLTLIHYIACSGFYPEKYHEGLVDAISKLKLRELFSGLLTKKLSARIMNEIISQKTPFIDKDNIPEKIKVFPKTIRLNLRIQLIFGSIFRNPAKSLINIFRMLLELAKRIFYPKGIVIFSSLDNKSTYLLMKRIKHYHLFNNTYTCVVNSDNISIIRLLKNLHFGGALIIDLEKDKVLRFFSKSVFYPYYEVSCADNIHKFSENDADKIINNLIRKMIKSGREH